MKHDKAETVLVEIHQNFSTDFNTSALFAFGSSVTPQIYKKCILHVLELCLAYSRIDMFTCYSCSKVPELYHGCNSLFNGYKSVFAKLTSSLHFSIFFLL